MMGISDTGAGSSDGASSARSTPSHAGSVLMEATGQSAAPALAALRQRALRQLQSVYSPEEAVAVFNALARHFLPDWQILWLQSRGEAPFPPQLLPEWERALQRLLRREPFSYITGRASFGGILLHVAPGVFIPRPETEAWAYALLNALQSRPPANVLDIGTGSGALAIFFARNMPYSHVFAIDKSALAVYYARENARSAGVAVRVERATFGEDPLPGDFPPVWDLIVSNPPYIPWSAYGETDQNVRLYEPPEALFCAGTALYEKMAAFAMTALSPEGTIAAELFPPQAEAVAEIWRQHGLSVVLHRDFAGRLRWISGQRN